MLSLCVRTTSTAISQYLHAGHVLPQRRRCERLQHRLAACRVFGAGRQGERVDPQQQAHGRRPVDLHQAALALHHPPHVVRAADADRPLAEQVRLVDAAVRLAAPTEERRALAINGETSRLGFAGSVAQRAEAYEQNDIDQPERLWSRCLSMPRYRRPPNVLVICIMWLSVRL